MNFHYGKKMGYAVGGEIREESEGSTARTGVRAGRNENIGDDTRARAMAWLEGKADGPKESAPKKTGPRAAMVAKASEEPVEDDSGRMLRMSKETAKSVVKTGQAAVAAKSERAGNIYSRTRGQNPLPPPIDTRPAIDTPDVRRQDRLREEAKARAASRARPVVSDDADSEDEDWEEMTPVQRSNARGAALRRALGMKHGGVVGNCLKGDFKK